MMMLSEFLSGKSRPDFQCASGYRPGANIESSSQSPPAFGRPAIRFSGTSSALHAIPLITPVAQPTTLAGKKGLDITMDKIIDARFERVEKALIGLIESVAKYHPHAKQALDLHEADNDLAKGLDDGKCDCREAVPAPS